jgi:uncharacterized repeat protein (TIGR01451 family)
MLRFLFRRRLETVALIATVFGVLAALAVTTATGATGPSQEGQPVLTMTKTADRATVGASDQIGFTITVTNDGTGTANSVTLSDPLPDGTANGWSFHPDYGGPGTCSISGPVDDQELDCSFGDLAADASATVHVVAKTYFEDCDEYDNTATASADNAPSVQATASVQCLKPDLSVTVVADQATVVAGNPLGFTIAVSNAGPGTARFVNLSDPLPARTATPWSIDPAYAGAGVCAITGNDGSQELDCSFGNLSANHSATVHVTAGTSVDDCTTYDTTATATDYNSPFAAGSASIACLPTELTISKTADAASVIAGNPIGFTIAVSNAGPGVATGVTLSDSLPAGTKGDWSIDSGPAGCSISGAFGSQTLDCAPVDLDAGESFTVHVMADTSLADCKVYENTATASATDLPGVQASATAACHEPQIDLAVTKVGTPNPDTVGNDITWTIVVTNNGPNTANGVTIADPIPAANEFVSATTTQGSCTGGPILHCNLHTMVAGAKVTITLVTTPTDPGTVMNTVAVVGDEAETNTSNNTASASIVVNQFTGPKPPRVFCVAVSKVSPKQLYVGRKTMLTIHLTRHGKAVKGDRVHIKGPKINVKTKSSNGKGVIKMQVKPKKKGILIFAPIASTRCNTKRVGITNVFTPRVTG